MRDRRRPLTEFAEKLEAMCRLVEFRPDVKPFLHPVSRREYPEYFETIERPIDISTIRNKIQTFEYKTCAEFLGDFELMKNNTVKFNGEDHDVTKEGIAIYELVKEEIVNYATKLQELEKAIKEAGLATDDHKEKEEKDDNDEEMAESCDEDEENSGVADETPKDDDKQTEKEATKGTGEEDETPEDEKEVAQSSAPDTVQEAKNEMGEVDGEERKANEDDEEMAKSDDDGAKGKETNEDDEGSDDESVARIKEINEDDIEIAGSDTDGVATVKDTKEKADEIATSDEEDLIGEATGESAQEKATDEMGGAKHEEEDNEGGEGEEKEAGVALGHSASAEDAAVALAGFAENEANPSGMETTWDATVRESKKSRRKVVEKHFFGECNDGESEAAADVTMEWTEEGKGENRPYYEL